MNLRFPPLSGGVELGLNDAGVETFEGDYAHYVIRECGQNSLDAAASTHEPVEMQLALRYIPSAELPFIAELRSTLDRCRAHLSADAKASDFFDRALRLARQRDVVLLRISDFGTTGVPGGDDERNKPWFGLVRSRGISVKNDDSSAGAFGIGKDAPLAASQFRTVLYSSRTQDGKVALQGICRLATHHDGTALTQGTGFIGHYNQTLHLFSALRDEGDIPNILRRQRPGLDVWIVGFQGETENWEDPFIAAALRNFWPAIHFERLKLSIGTKQIDQKTLPSLMQTFAREESVREAYPYFQAVTGTGLHLREEQLDLAGNCRLHVRLGTHELPRRICMTRKTGMVIYYYLPKSVRVPFAGLFQCDDPRGNHLLKALEPPCHDNWEPKRAKTPQEKEVLKEIKAWISSCLKTMIPNLNAEVINEESIADFLPDELPGDSTSDSKETDLGGRPASQPRPELSELITPKVKTEGDGNYGRARPGTGGGEGDTVDPKKGDGARTGGRINRGGNDGEHGGEAARSRPDIVLRSYSDNGTTGTYNLVARSTYAYDGDLRIDAVTEDGSSISCPLTGAFDANGSPLSVDGNKIIGISIPENGALRLRIITTPEMRLALRASAL